MNYRIETEVPIAEYSPDHQSPRGALELYGGPDYDWVDGNNPFMDEMAERFKDDLTMLDMGCATGILVRDALMRNFDAVGVDGTDSALKMEEDTIWKEWYNKRLFHSDLSEPFQIYKDGEPAKFKLITSWEVMEHIMPERMHLFLNNVHKHLKDDGVFAFSVSPFKTRKKPNTHLAWEMRYKWRWAWLFDKAGFKFEGPIKEKFGAGYHYMFDTRYRGRVKRNRHTWWSTLKKK